MNAAYRDVELQARRTFNGIMGAYNRPRVKLPVTREGWTLRRVHARKPYATPSGRSFVRHSHLQREVFDVGNGRRTWRVTRFWCGAYSWFAVLSWQPDPRGVCAKCELAASGVTTVKVKRGTSNSNVRGNSRDRRRRRQFLVDTYGDGNRVKCYRCPVVLTVDTVTVDRIVPGRDGGRYVRDNIRPSCASCASETGNELQGSATS